jgi:hypothetical protein
MEAPSFDSSLFDWFTAHEPAGESTFSSLGISPKRGKAPPAFDVAGPGSTTRTFLHQYDVQSDSEERKAKCVAVYWYSAPSGEKTTAYVYYC